MAVAAFITQEAEMEMVALVRKGMEQQTGQASKWKGEETGVGITTITVGEAGEAGEVGVGEVKRQEVGKAREGTLQAVEVEKTNGRREEGRRERERESWGGNEEYTKELGMDRSNTIKLHD